MIDVEILKKHIYDVLGAIYEVHNELGPGLNEYCYQEGLNVELSDPIPRPAFLDEMLALARTLSDPFPFVRVDLYDVGRLYFGELTFFPGSGFWNVSPISYDDLLGSKLKLPKPNFNIELYNKIMSR